jgi:hypothetical protein
MKQTPSHSVVTHLNFIKRLTLTFINNLHNSNDKDDSSLTVNNSKESEEKQYKRRKETETKRAGNQSSIEVNDE